AQPFGAASIYNFTVIGQPYDGDHATAWRDNMRAQFGNCIFMDIGEYLIRDEGTAGDGGGYGSAGVPTLLSLFSTPYNSYPTNTVGVDPKVLYPNFTSGNWCQFTDCVFFRNFETATLNTFGVMAPAYRNKIEDNIAKMPIQNLVRSAPVQVGGKVMAQVTKLNPLPAYEALTAGGTAPDDGFFSPVAYKGAFGGYNWLKGWSAADAYGLLD
ncbi:MAG TPA: hypothetical protein PLS24_08000, partial [Sedimentisphaerales bacterium]|nr:hypothetical protein [Sedimentisphaerales bacterium]